MTQVDPKPERGFFARLLRGIFFWLSPIHRDRVGGQTVLVYTSFPKAFYFYLVWLPGFIILGLHRYEMLSETAVVWWMFGFCFLTYMVIAEDTGPMGFILFAMTIVTSLVLYNTGNLDWAGAHKLADALKQLKFALDPATLIVLNTTLFVVWCAVYLFAVTWKKRELSSLRRSKLRPPLGRRPMPIAGRVVDNQVRDVFELIFGFGAYDVEISYPGGKTIEVDKNCVGLALKLGTFVDIISHIPTREEERVAAAEVGEVFG